MSNEGQQPLPLRGQREELPARRLSRTQKVKIGGSSSIYLNMGEHPDGRLGEIFINMSKVGTFQQGMLNAFGIVFSVALQHGVPLEELVHSLKYSAFEPAGVVTGDDEIGAALSVVDWVVKRLEKEYLNGSNSTNT